MSNKSFDKLANVECGVFNDNLKNTSFYENIDSSRFY